MIVRVINIHVKHGFDGEFIKACRENRAGSIREPGILRFDVLQDSGDSLHFVLYEVYKDESAAVEHKSTSHYKKWRDIVEPWMAKPRESTSCIPIAPAEDSAW
ncbi:MAG: antibiotic biosynthesis monooxygenase [Spirochaetes bacterium]|nr:antibiotic biosynthesis monooxygenase [Spirochaetota bacterium]